MGIRWERDASHWVLLFFSLCIWDKLRDHGMDWRFSFHTRLLCGGRHGIIHGCAAFAEEDYTRCGAVTDIQKLSK